MGNTREHFKKIRDTKGILHEKIGTIKDRNGMDLTEAEDIKKRWPKKKKKKKKGEVARTCKTTIQKKIFMTQITTMV